jgi:uncharacterized protein YdeI (YjbR/CyaY-like superfamily)
MPSDPLPKIFFDSKAAWLTWLSENHEKHRGVWIKFAKKGSGIESLTYAEAVEVALCHGWIDGQAKSLDEKCYLQRFVPRRPDSIWSAVNREKALDLIKRGLMKPAGLAAIERAKVKGRWEIAYASASKAQVPPDLQAALDSNPKAAAFFETLKGANRYAILFRIETAKKPETRAARIEKFVGMLERGETLH